uniref:Uncharacterized protein n=1 Tax=Lepeophtheirus salmonis TaxID=72036 RepID=A0A0K2V5D6_LEPSM
MYLTCPLIKGIKLLVSCNYTFLSSFLKMEYLLLFPLRIKNLKVCYQFVQNI